MRKHHIVLSFILLLLGCYLLSYPSSFELISIYKKHITPAQFDSHARDVKSGNIVLIPEEHRYHHATIDVRGEFILQSKTPSHTVDLLEIGLNKGSVKFNFVAMPDHSFTPYIAVSDNVTRSKYVAHPFRYQIHVFPNKAYSFRLHVKDDGAISYYLGETDSNSGHNVSASIKNKWSQFQVEAISLGSALDQSNQFSGKIYNLVITYNDSIAFLSEKSAILLGLLFVILSLAVTFFCRQKQTGSYKARSVVIYTLVSILIFSYPLLQLYSANVANVNYVVILKYMLQLSLIAVFVFITLLAVYGNLEKALMTTLIAAIVVFFSGKLYSYISYMVHPDTFLFCALLFLSLCHLLIQKIYISAGFASNLVKIICVVYLICVATLVYYLVSFAMVSKENASGVVTATVQAKAKPDIYFIITDMHASQSSIKRHLGYSNAEFIASMRKMHFYVPNNAASNYPYTVLSVPSMLNLAYIPATIRSEDELKPYFGNSYLAAYLKKLGYKFIFISPRRYFVEKSDIADVNMTCSKISDFEGFLWGQSIFFRANKFGKAYRKDVLCGFDKVKSVVSLDGPKFVFAHILSPHPPYVFGANGEQVPLEDQLDTRTNSKTIVFNKNGYKNQLIYIEKQLLSLADYIQKHSKRPPIIIIQGDHGFPLYTNPDLASGTIVPPDVNINARMRVLSAYYFPNGGNTVLYDTISPINMTRGVLRYYFKRADMAKISDTSRWAGEANLFKQVDVTRNVRRYDE